MNRDKPVVIDTHAFVWYLEDNDRIVVATALVFGAALVSKDAGIRDSGFVECIW